MKTVYISGGITGVDNYIDNFHKAAKRLASKGYIPVDPCSLPHNHNQTYEDYMKEDLQALLKCDAIFMLPGWKNSKEATLEYKTAMLCGIDQIVG